MWHAVCDGKLGHMTTIDPTLPTPQLATGNRPAPEPRAPLTSSGTRWDQAVSPPEEDSFSFWDFLDIVNPLQHIPIVSDLYRSVTGDEIKAPARIIGGTLFGGFIGFAGSLANAVIEQSSGSDIGGHISAAAGSGSDDAEGDPVIAEAGEIKLAAANGVMSDAEEFGRPNESGVSGRSAVRAYEAGQAARTNSIWQEDGHP